MYFLPVQLIYHDVHPHFWTQYFRVIRTLHWDLISNLGVTWKGLYLPSSVIHYYKSQTQFSKGHYLSMPRILICNFIFKFITEVVLSFKSNIKVQIRSDQSLSRVQLFATPWIAAHQATLSITNSRSSLGLTSIKSVMPSSHLILCCPLLLLPPIPPSIRVFSSESTLRMRWPKYWTFSFSIIPSKEIPGLISFRMDGLDLLAVGPCYLAILYIMVWICNPKLPLHPFPGPPPWQPQVSSLCLFHIHFWC